ncbi:MULTISPECIES: helix-turn-helix transcriptional regulator [Streptomyces]|uniref:HTH cro/C1-type domain-containing protein n=2 Tax=Streptomyces TaxID=1883 RepID=A0A4Y3QTI5_STRCI|nr:MULTISPECIES: helix-turn-helix transcriptional regulator [Streptomyces]QKI29080.1 XRE family transcriptional regulator [Streptomyces cacaoi]GEB47977.1 hypothetical protein SCA03_05280 [Streptomyces cacaoi]
MSDGAESPTGKKVRKAGKASKPGQPGRGAATGDKSSERIYNRIALMRIERGISRRQLADALDVHYQTVGYLERGEYSPSLHLALRIAAYYGTSVESVFALEPFPRIGSEE